MIAETVGMRIQAFVAFVVTSEQLDPVEIQRHLGMTADKTSRRASQLKDPPRPRFNVCRFQCSDSTLPITEQIEQVAARVKPISHAIRRLVEESDAGAKLSVVRYFNDPDGEEERIDQAGDLVKLAGQHQLLGWHLSAELLRLLIDTHAILDVDEYG
ncbi:MAG: DUF4279 domain-containing protein [Actinomycetota bacterium]|nr:DUF4279 domain-containing protein [Actinomycetota bacterium]